MVFPVLALCLALSGGSTDGSDVTVQLDTAEFSLLFRLPFGSHTRMFLQEVTKACVVNERNGLGDSPENIVIQKCSLFKPVAQSALLVPSTGLDPATRDPEFQWLSRYRCAPPQEAGSPTLRDWNSAPGTWPACGTIGGGRYPSHKKRWGLEQVLPQGAGSVLFRGGAKAQTNFRLAEVARGGVAEWGRHARGGRRYEELEEAGREMSAAAGSRERDSAGRAGGGKLGWGRRRVALPGHGVERCCGLAGGRMGRDQGPGRPEVGTLGLKFCGDVILSRA
ncbi:Hypothetical predicted protein [Marmota monax]|uniref:Type II inositol 1 4 5-trisphosphate 5-phosphatase n=1 Tax=Marmota monax TaxID=9995 RepID=A0A5E4A514_MARMO|nr:type II inositol 1 4 5-trisphosphate 5-phosphatase [Marmota monax]VTJ52373.1 Hypothetical predicted protein [Marmota monax]